MAKHAVPKRKTSKARTSSRHKSFMYKTQNYWKNAINLGPCPNCNQAKLHHHVCPQCGIYRGKKILDFGKEAEKITKIKA